MIKEHQQIYRKIAFLFAVTLNLGSLFFFKYYDFFIENINVAFHTDIRALRIALPLGISFFTFQQLSYIIDSYHRDQGISAYSFIDYALFVSYFPQLVAGPIVTHDEMVPQFADISKKQFNLDNFAKGIFAFTLGLAKKVLIADALGKAVNMGFTEVSQLGCGSAVVVMLAYTLQIYFDFSGYCDMATGIGKMMNIDITMNFNSPYKAVSIIDFWKRWHITLTRFFTKYVYIPLGGNRKGTIRTYVNILVVFLISGLWHGANWTFIIWGGVHGVAQILNRIIDKRPCFISKSSNRISRFARWAMTFMFINLTWILFRSNSIGQAILFYKRLFSFCSLLPDKNLVASLYPSILTIIPSIIPHSSSFLGLLMIAVGIIGSVTLNNTNEKLVSFKPSIKGGIITGCLMTACILSLAGVSSFLSWNF